MSASVSTWVGRLKAGDSSAAQQLWQRYFAKLVSLARHKLGGTPRRAADEEDVALSAFYSFCQAVDSGRFPVLENRDDLWQILVMHTARKAIDQKRYQGRQKRQSAAVDGDVALEEIVGEEPDPAFAASVAEDFHRLIELLDEPLLRQVAIKKLEGFTNAEIANQLQLGLRSVERKLAVIRAVWNESPGGSQA
jgi:DNA-directed RNA polymerase specialized sigma24 family protein